MAPLGQFKRVNIPCTSSMSPTPAPLAASCSTERVRYAHDLRLAHRHRARVPRRLHLPQARPGVDHHHRHPWSYRGWPHPRLGGHQPSGALHRALHRGWGIGLVGASHRRSSPCGSRTRPAASCSACGAGFPFHHARRSSPSIAAASGWQGVFWFVIIFATVALILFNIFYKVPGGEGASYNVEESNFSGGASCS